LVRIRLQRHGRKKLPYYHIVAADKRQKRDGRIVESLGRFNPLTAQGVSIDTERVLYWLKNGAQPSDAVRGIFKREGIYYRLHLERWNKSPEEIEATIAAWKEGKTEGVANKNSRKEQLARVLKAEAETAKKKAAERAAAEKAAAEAPAPAAEAPAAEATETPAAEA
jgi:small subunit ribosomal protein S16